MDEYMLLRIHGFGSLEQILFGDDILLEIWVKRENDQWEEL